MSAAEVLAQHQWGTGTCICGPMVCSHDDMAAHQLDALKAAGYAVVKLPNPVAPPDHWRTGIIGAWQGPIGEEPVSAWSTNQFDPDAVAMPGGDFITIADARALGLALLAAANAAEAQS